MPFQNRREAGQKLAEQLSKVSLEQPIIIALPRGGVPVAQEVSRILNIPLDVVVVRKLSSPENPEFGIGAVAEDGTYWINHEVAAALGINPAEIEETIVHQTNDCIRRANHYRGHRPFPDLTGRSVILIDDGLATGSTAVIACRLIRNKGAKKIIFATPVAAARSTTHLHKYADQVVTLAMPEHFGAVGYWYDDFSPVTDEEVIRLLRNKTHVDIPDGSIFLAGDLTVPNSATGLAIFAYSPGSSRLSPRNLTIAESLNQNGIATLLFDLLTPEESAETDQFDLSLLVHRLRTATNWCRSNEATKDLAIGYYGTGTGVAAAILAAIDHEEVSAIVSRGGRPDLAGREFLARNTAPTLLIVGGKDPNTADANRRASRFLPNSELVIIPEASHRFEEPGALESVGRHATAWFSHHFPKYQGESKTALTDKKEETMDALEILKNDHQRIKNLVDRMKNMDQAQQRQIMENLRNELQINSYIEENVFYPAFSKFEDFKEVLDEFAHDRDEIRKLFNSVGPIPIPKEEMKNRFEPLAESIEDHFRQEESQFFPMVRRLMKRPEREQLGRHLEAAKEEQKAA